MNRQTLYAVLLTVEAALLIAMTYFFWQISSFPAARAETGITTAEWLWIVALVVPLVSMEALWAATRNGRWIAGALAVYAVFALFVLTRPDISYAIDRADWLWTLGLLVPVYALKIALMPRNADFGVHPALTLCFSAFFVLMAVAVLITPDVTGYPSRGWGMLARPAFGMAWAIFLTDFARFRGSMEVILRWLAGFSVLLGYYALTATQYDLTKSGVFRPFIEIVREWPQFAPFDRINTNEIAGAMAWLIPLVGLMMFYRWSWGWRAVAGLGAGLMALALAFGQSRSAIIGVVGVGVLLALWLAPRGRWQVTAVGVVGLLAVLQAALLFNLLPGSAGEGLSARDQITASERFEYWRSAGAIIADFPLTGVGMNMYRDPRVRRDYPVENVEYEFPPHTHNEFVQMATDFGIPGFVAYSALLLIVGYMGVVSIRRGDERARLVAAGALAGLVAHGIYGLGDAIPIWDRFAFLFWLMIGVISAQYALLRESTPE